MLRRHKIPAALMALGFAVSCVVNIFEFSLAKRLNRMIQVSNDMSQQRIFFERLHFRLAQAESYRLSYLLTNNPSYLEAFEKAKIEINELKYKLMGLYSNAPMVQILEALPLQVENKLREIDLSLHIARCGQAKHEEIFLFKEFGKDTNRRISRAACEMEVELKNQDKRLALASLELSRQGAIASGGGLVFEIMLFVLAFCIVIWDKRKLQGSERTLMLAKIELEKRAEKLLSVNADLEQFAYIASHDLKEPLRAISGFGALFKSKYAKSLDPRGLKWLSHMTEGANRMEQLINDLLAYAGLNNRTISPVPVNTEALVKDIILEMQPLIEQNKATVISKGLPEIVAPCSLLRQIFQNLISNAIKFRRKDLSPTLEIEAIDLGNYWRFEFRDNGIGIATEHQDRIFKIFERVHGRVDYQGTGIGLAICKKAIELMGGELKLKSNLGRGSVFSFTIKKERVHFE